MLLYLVLFGVGGWEIRLVLKYSSLVQLFILADQFLGLKEPLALIFTIWCGREGEREVKHYRSPVIGEF